MKEYGLDFVKYVFNNLSLEKKSLFKIIGFKDDIICLQYNNVRGFIEKNEFLIMLKLSKNELEYFESEYNNKNLIENYEYELGLKEQQRYFESTRF